MATSFAGGAIKHPTALALAAAALLSSFAAAASEIAVTTTMEAVVVHDGANGGSTRGYAFTPSQDIFVDGVGIWDEGGDGLQEGHQVGIWDSGMNLLVSSTIQAGTTSPILGGSVEGGWFRYEEIAPLLLHADTEYLIGGRFSGLPGSDTLLADFDDRATTTTHPWITITGFERSHFGSFGFPEFSSDPANAGYFGPNFTFTPIPEPSILTLLGCGLAGFGVARLRPPRTASRLARDRHRAPLRGHHEGVGDLTWRAALSIPALSSGAGNSDRGLAANPRGTSGFEGP